mmetsp:Transcript_25274/g.69683  ORF Transcript_25274/g.69683 Transcript_25274/m.69683 type:complete len:83 (-) Transcript_25274:3043-3291(-)
MESSAGIFFNELFRIIFCDDDYVGASLYDIEQTLGKYHTVVHRNWLLDAGVMYSVQWLIALSMVITGWIGTHNIATAPKKPN